MHIIMNNMTLNMRVANFCRSGFLGEVSSYCFKEKFACSSLFPDYVLKKCRPKVFTKYLSLRTNIRRPFVIVFLALYIKLTAASGYIYLHKLIWEL